MTQSLAEKSYDHIRQMLASGQLPPGKRLVNRTLAAEIGVSVIPVREAINRLASEGLVDHVPGSGAFARDISRQDLDNLYVLRDALESCAAAEAARHVTEDELQEFDYILQQIRQTADAIAGSRNGYSNKRQLNEWMDNEQHFHELLIDASRNPLLAKVVRENRAISAVFECQRNDPRLLTADLAARTCKSKMQLVDALRERASARARQLMSDQIQQGRKTVLGYLARKRRPGS
ncbi:HTH-type transcriptional regulator McbR [Rubripirellula lacrimiformis]|uniref:HTH-type transcriptional regulator McbR n=1 Tax=Rubripirellula lacrimiformis TaxID=1930273 RepID=A0A517NF08_9BACT|nr:GntR family transcriptional regulator [Rubripirellula lacrimiformis]QDT05638.1 HTH-type transcriptional regulator McbR [Rubripirellula lacrimiformis]